MANDADAVRKDLRKRGYRVEKPTGRGRTSYNVHDPNTGDLIARFPISPSPGSWRRNLEAAINRYERTGVPARSSKSRAAASHG
jgi:hypothetical protein